MKSCVLKKKALSFLICLTVVFGGQVLAEDSIDWDKARKLFQMEQSGGQLSAEEQLYLQHAKEVRQATQGKPSGQGENATGRQAPRSETNLVPLTDLTGDYKGEDGGLYGKGRNEPPPELAAKAKAQTAGIQPLDSQGKPSPNGKIVLLSIGMSNTTGEFSSFIPMANADPAKSARVILVDGAQGGQSADKIANPGAPFWETIDRRLAQSGVTAQQVQVIWLKEAIPQPKEGFPAEMIKLKNFLIDDINIAQSRYPNLRIAYLSSRIYGGYATVPLNPEPYAYETAFANRWLIQAQMNNEPKLNCDPAKGNVNAPLLLWGPYLWADGMKGRKTDNFVWSREDFGPDGTHPSRASGCGKVAELLLRFFKTDSNTRLWFIKE